jgi:transposase-like protein
VTAKGPFIPFCLSCQQAGHLHQSPPTGEQHYICAHCHRRWVAQPSAS